MTFVLGLIIGILFGMLIMCATLAITDIISHNREFAKIVHDQKQDELSLENEKLNSLLTVYKKYYANVNKINGIKLPNKEDYEELNDDK